MNSFSIANLGARTFPAVAALTAARKLPLRITCLGEARYAGNNPDLDSCTLIRTVDLGQCSSLDDAIACVERLSGRDHLETGEGDAMTFKPRLFVVIDGEQCQVLAGEPSHRSVRWCDPVASDGETRLVVAKASKLRGEASSEARRDNAASAQDLRFRASILEGRLVHADWRQTVRAALLRAA